MSHEIKKYVEISRPGFWFITLWCYIAALHGNGQTLATTNNFWLGLVYVTFPVNLLLYAWNDIDDGNIDRLNPRKGKYLLGVASIANEELKRATVLGFLLNVLFIAYFAYVLEDIRIVLWFACACVTNFVYNTYPGWRTGPPPLDFVGPLGYVLILYFSTIVNQISSPSPSCVMFHTLMVFRSQLWGQIIDLSSDEKGGRKTTAVALGVVKARVLLASLVLGEFAIAWFGIGDSYVCLFSGLCLAQALVEIFFYPPQAPNLAQAALTGLVMTPAAGLLLIHVWTSPVF